MGLIGVEAFSFSRSPLPIGLFLNCLLKTQGKFTGKLSPHHENGKIDDRIGKIDHFLA